MRRIEFTPEQIQDMKEKYNSGMSLDTIGKNYNVSNTVLRRVFKENEIQIRSIKEANSKNIPEEIAEKVIYNYCVLKKGLMPSGEPYGLKQYMVEKILKEYGIKKRTYVESKDTLRKYEIKDDYFKTQCHNMAYILGFLASDGNVAKKENRIQIQLAEYDKEILEKINNELGNTRPIKICPRNDGHTDNAVLTFYSSTIKKDLAHYNIIPEKTSVLKPPYFLQQKYIISYIRGYFDGDGSIHEANNTIAFTIGGVSKEVLEWMRSYLAETYSIVNNGLYKQPLPSGKTFYNLTYYGEKAKQIYSLLYNNNGLFMERKYNRFTQLVNK